MNQGARAICPRPFHFNQEINSTMKKLMFALILTLLCSISFAQELNPADEFKAVGFNQKALFRVVNDLVTAANTRCLTDAAAANGDPASSTSIVTNPVVYTIDGVFYSVASTASIAFSSGHAAQPVLTQCYYLFQIDSAGNWSSVQGPILSTSSPETLQMPRPTAGCCPIFAVKVSLASTATFTPGTTLFTASNVTETYYDLSIRPISLKY